MHKIKRKLYTLAIHKHHLPKEKEFRKVDIIFIREAKLKHTMKR